LRDKQAIKFSEPTKREFKVAKRWPDEATSRKKILLSGLIPFPRSYDPPDVVNPRPVAGRSGPTQRPLNHSSINSTTRDIEKPIQRNVSDPFLAHDDQPAPSAQLSSGPRFQSHMATNPGDSGRELLRKRSSDVFLDNTNRAHGDKKRIRAVLPHR
jgi:hypothetical protein